MYPVLLDISQQKIILIGAGKIATRKVISLLAGGGRCIQVIAPKATPEIKEFAQAGQLTYLSREYQKGDLAGFDFVFICTDDPSVNLQVRNEVGSNQWVNDTTCKERSTFCSPGVVTTKEFTYTVSSHVQDPRKTKAAKEELQAWLEGKQS